MGRPKAKEAIEPPLLTIRGAYEVHIMEWAEYILSIALPFNRTPYSAPAVLGPFLTPSAGGIGEAGPRRVAIRGTNSWGRGDGNAGGRASSTPAEYLK